MDKGCLTVAGNLWVEERDERADRSYDHEWGVRVSVEESEPDFEDR